MSELTIEKLRKARAIFDEADQAEGKYSLKHRPFWASSEQLKECFDIDVPEGYYYCDENGLHQRS